MRGWGIGSRKVPSKAGDGLWKIDFGSFALGVCDSGVRYDLGLFDHT